MKFFSLAFIFGACALVAAMAANAAGSAKVIKLLSVQQGQTRTKTGFVVRDTDFVGTKKVGHDTLACTVVSRQRASCRLVVTLAGGTIIGRIPIVFTRSSGAGPVTGGTGTYAGAKGTVAYRNLNQKGTRTAVVISLK